MDIVSRLKIFLQENGISNSLFADNCGIPRPTLSQLLNGRNKKVSDELIAKIHAAYPALNVMWLMFGDGDMFVPNANNPAGSASAQPAENSIEFTGSNMAQQNPARATTISFGAKPDHQGYREQRPQQSTMQPTYASVPPLAMVRPVATKGGKSNFAADEARVTLITVYYSDGRFQSFVPQE